MIFLIHYINFFMNTYVMVYFFIFESFNINIKKCTSIDFSLVYGLTNIHPLFFYASLISILLVIFSKSNTKIYIKVINIFYLSLYSMYLGGFWGLGNSSWGFFWLNDSIELVLVFTIVLITSYIHMQLTVKNYILFLFIFIFITLYLIFFRFSLLTTRHNFFNIKSINNILILNLIFFFFQKIKFNLSYINILLYNNLKILFLNLLYFFKKYFYLYSKSHIFYHVSIFSFIMLFLKYRENNISIFYKVKSYWVNNFFYFFENYNTFYNFIFSKNLYLYKFFLSNLYLYKFKKIIFYFFIFLSYWNYIYLMFFLTSTLKIVPK